jgi:hypothetical protein
MKLKMILKLGIIIILGILHNMGRNLLFHRLLDLFNKLNESNWKRGKKERDSIQKEIKCQLFRQEIRSV